ncbi:hypothetical protein ABG768_008195 [Culter alburnus]|uniref:Uncharacterized protein n=1 Tax=Culter alburnus TaxID=194366 RepID=A0AAW1ZJ00_CULAL
MFRGLKQLLITDNKSLGKALDSAAKERDCEDLKLWRPAVINHLYWTAASTPNGDKDVMEDKWKSMFRTSTNMSLLHFPAVHIHLWRGNQVQHTVFTVLVKALVKAFGSFPQHQTFSLEAFHHILTFAPKHTGFSFLGMYSRLLLAALHFNHNGSREVARTRCVMFLKGGYVVRPIKEKPSYALMESLRVGYSRWRTQHCLVFLFPLPSEDQRGSTRICWCVSSTAFTIQYALKGLPIVSAQCHRLFVSHLVFYSPNCNKHLSQTVMFTQCMSVFWIPL